MAIKNFRKLAHAELTFQSGLNVLVGGKKVGKTAVVDALMALLAGHDEPFPRLCENDLHCLPVGKPSGDIVFEYVFSGLDLDDEADFLADLVPNASGKLQAHITIRYSESDKAGRLRAKRWCGEHEGVGLTADMMENLRGVCPPITASSLEGMLDRSDRHHQWLPSNVLTVLFVSQGSHLPTATDFALISRQQFAVLRPNFGKFTAGLAGQFKFSAMRH